MSPCRSAYIRTATWPCRQDKNLKGNLTSAKYFKIEQSEVLIWTDKGGLSQLEQMYTAISVFHNSEIKEGKKGKTDRSEKVSYSKASYGLTFSYIVLYQGILKN